MTLRPEQIGDKGQRYEVRYLKVDDDESQSARTFGWSNDFAGAQSMADAAMLRPSTSSAWVVDRQPRAPSNESASGAHRWIDFKDMCCCRQCGIVRRRDGLNKPCKGITKLRPMEGTLP